MLMFRGGGSNAGVRDRLRVSVDRNAAGPALFLVRRDRALAVAAMAGTDSAELAPQKGAATL